VGQIVTKLFVSRESPFPPYLHSYTLSYYLAIEGYAVPKPVYFVFLRIIFALAQGTLIPLTQGALISLTQGERI
jgi:hypothetical protein